MHPLDPSDPSEPRHPVDASDLGALAPLADQVAETMARVASDVALVIDGQGIVRRVAEGGRSLPASCGAWVGQRWVDTASADSRRKIELLLDELQSSGVTQRREVNHPGRDGDDMPMAWTAIRLGAQGPVVAVGRDLRAVAAIQRRFMDAQHEMELDYWQRRHADQRYRLMFQVARDAVLAVDASSFEVIEANPAARSLLGAGLPAGTSLIGRMLPKLLPDGARAAAAELLLTARTVGRAAEIPLRLAAGAPAGSLSATPFRVGDRQQLLVWLRTGSGAGAGQEGDVDADGAADGSLPASMRGFVESTPDAVVITDSAGCVEVANPAFLRLVQHGSEARIKGRPLHELVTDRDGSWRALVARTRLQGLCTHVPLRLMHGSVSIDVQASSALLADGDQEHLGFTLRMSEPALRPVAPSASGWPVLARLQAQVGLSTLDELMHEGQRALERRLIVTALRRGGTQLGTAASLLGLSAQALRARMQGLGLSGADLDDEGEGDDAAGGDASEPPPTLLN